MCFSVCYLHIINNNTHYNTLATLDVIIYVTYNFSAKVNCYGLSYIFTSLGISCRILDANNLNVLRNTNTGVSPPTAGPDVSPIPYWIDRRPRFPPQWPMAMSIVLRLLPPL